MSLPVIILLSSYLLGSIPTGLLLAKACGIDIRATGSGNIGATNVYRTVGRKLGVITLVLDCIKGLVPVLAAQHFGLPEVWIAGVGLAAFLGHIYTIFLKFKGGKGVATALGVFLGISPLAVLFVLILFILVVWKWRLISLGSITAAAVFPILTAALDRRPLVVAMTIIIAALVIFKHKENIKRLREGTESKFKA